MNAWSRSPLLHAALCGALCSGTASISHATELSGSELEVHREPDASDCPDARALSHAVVALGATGNPPSTRLRIEVSFERTTDGYAGTIYSFGSKPGVRRLALAGRTCEPLAEAVSVALAILLDLVPSPERRKEADVSRAVPPPERVAPPFVLEAGARAGVAYGEIGSAVSAVFSPALRLSRERFQVLASAFWNTPNEGDFRAGFVRVGLWGGGVDACYRVESRDRATLGFAPCAGLRLGALSGEGVQFDENYQASQTWLALSASGTARLPLTKKWGFIASLSAIVPLRQHTFSVAGAGLAFESEPIAALLEFGPEVRIW